MVGQSLNLTFRGRYKENFFAIIDFQKQFHGYYYHVFFYFSKIYYSKKVLFVPSSKCQIQTLTYRSFVPASGRGLVFPFFIHKPHRDTQSYYPF